MPGRTAHPTGQVSPVNCCWCTEGRVVVACSRLAQAARGGAEGARPGLLLVLRCGSVLVGSSADGPGGGRRGRGEFGGSSEVLWRAAAADGVARAPSGA